MSTYAVGDIQGCLAPLQCLLEQVNFNPAHDRLWVAGDMVNRGPESLETLRFLHSLGNSLSAVLGNHDLHLLALAYGHKAPSKGDTLDSILKAEDREQLIYWLRQRPLIHTDSELNYTMVHAGIPPQWDLPAALKYSAEVESVLRDDSRVSDFLKLMYGNQPAQWHEGLQGQDRLRIITNYLTRMRFCKADGELDLECKTSPEFPPEDYAPWFAFQKRLSRSNKLIVGHWAALKGVCKAPNVFALDTGCVWGGQLTLLRLDDEQRFQCDCKEKK